MDIGDLVERSGPIQSLSTHTTRRCKKEDWSLDMVGTITNRIEVENKTSLLPKNIDGRRFSKLDVSS